MQNETQFHARNKAERFKHRKRQFYKEKQFFRTILMNSKSPTHAYSIDRQADTHPRPEGRTIYICCF